MSKFAARAYRAAFILTQGYEGTALMQAGGVDLPEAYLAWAIRLAMLRGARNATDRHV